MFERACVCVFLKLKSHHKNKNVRIWMNDDDSN
jgi:hypothetical protein